MLIHVSLGRLTIDYLNGRQDVPVAVRKYTYLGRAQFGVKITNTLLVAKSYRVLSEPTSLEEFQGILNKCENLESREWVLKYRQNLGESLYICR